jgi:phage terminase large subunit-like protein
MVEGGKPGDPGRMSRVALLGDTIDGAREVMVFGPSGILACAPPDRRPEWQASRKRLVWPNGAVAQVFSASNPESLRGPQFDGAWCDEVGKWKRGEDAWDMLQLGLRLGQRPRALVTTTPRAVPLLTRLLDERGTVVTRASTVANRMHLAEGFLETVLAKYAGSRLARQEIDGELVLDVEGALWTWPMIEAARAPRVGEVDRIVVAVDPPVTATGDACGIVVAGVQRQGTPHQWTAEVIADHSLEAPSPDAWAQRVIELYHAHGADRVVAEVNQGGDLVATLIRNRDPSVKVAPVRASKGKAARAEPVAMLYEQGRVRHAHVFRALEDQMTAMTVGGYLGRGSPDRVDALVWALTDLIVEPAGRLSGDPRIRAL